jgi:hypothetical protein
VPDGPLNPAALLGVLSACGVDFVVVGALAVGLHSDVRATGEVIADTDIEVRIQTA